MLPFLQNSGLKFRSHVTMTTGASLSLSAKLLSSRIKPFVTSTDCARSEKSLSSKRCFRSTPMLSHIGPTKLKLTSDSRKDCRASFSKLHVAAIPLSIKQRKSADCRVGKIFLSQSKIAVQGKLFSSLRRPTWIKTLFLQSPFWSSKPSPDWGPMKSARSFQ